MKAVSLIGCQMVAILLASCADGGKAVPETDAGADAGADGGSDECTPGVWNDDFDEADCPDMSGWDDCVVHVRSDVAQGGDGKTWSTAFSDIQTALETARCGRVKTDLCSTWEVWAAEGTYYVFKHCPEDTIWLRTDVALYGGFAGDETALEQRDPAAHETVISGNQESAGVEHVSCALSAYGIDAAILDGITVTGASSEDVGGGGLFAIETDDLVIRGCIFRDNSALFGGGVLFTSSTALIEESHFLANFAASSGGGIFFSQSEGLIQDCVFEDNSALGFNSSGGAVIVTNGSVVSVTESAFSGNSTGVGGGAIRVVGASLELSSSSFTNNTAANMGGAGSFESSLVAVSNCTVEGNTAGEFGGAFYETDSSLEMVETSLMNNSLDGLAGGAVAGIGGSISCRECSIVGNSADPTFGMGGGIFAQSVAPFEVTGSEFLDNSAANGAGIAAVLCTGSVIANDVFAGGSAEVGGGILANGDVVVSGCTFQGNTVSGSGGSVYLQDGAIAIENSILWGGAPNELGWLDLEEPVDVNYSNVQGGFSGEGNIDADPLFADAAGGDYHLLAGSPCIDAADGDAVPDLDFDGNPRVDDPGTPNTGIGDPPYADMGAFEWQVGE